MLVYGDRQYRQDAAAFLRSLRARWMQTRTASLDDARTLLIQSGQLEQALADCDLPDRLLRQRLVHLAMQLTDSLAKNFCDLYLPKPNSAPLRSDISDALSHLLNKVNRMLPIERQLTIRIPEGFACYTLFPEQYCTSALAWLEKNPRVRAVLVIGIRTIGTTLSAVVKQTLIARGLNVTRFTVRPHGAPFTRQATLEISDAKKFQHVLVVDEGPGISGSSLAAVAQACVAAGLTNVSFLPGHTGNPGSAARDEVRACWRRTPRFVTALEAVRWKNQSIEQILAQRVQQFGLWPDQMVTVKNLGAGRWRKIVFPNESEWPAAAIQFECSKYLCHGRTAPAVLWKFAGLHCESGGRTAAELAFDRLLVRAEVGFCAKPLDVLCGFIAMPWIDGMRLTRSDASTPGVLHRIGQYIVHAAGAPLSSSESNAALNRLAKMSYWNAKESLGHSSANRVVQWIKAARTTETPLASGDSHLAPHEWVRTATGEIFKTDAEGEQTSHTTVGRQPLLWDIAAAIAEWNLSSADSSALLEPILPATGPLDFRALNFYRMAYHAFQMGLMHLSANQISDEAEISRLIKSARHHREQLRRILAGEDNFSCAPHELAPIGTATFMSRNTAATASTNF